MCDHKFVFLRCRNLLFQTDWHTFNLTGSFLCNMMRCVRINAITAPLPGRNSKFFADRRNCIEVYIGQKNYWHGLLVSFANSYMQCLLKQLNDNCVIHWWWQMHRVIHNHSLFCSSLFFAFNRITIFDNLPVGRSWHSFSKLTDNHIFLFGGYSDYSCGEKPLGSFSKLFFSYKFNFL